MTQSSVLTLPTHALSGPLRAVQRLSLVALTWQLRRRTRQNLGKLTDHLLRDIGLDPWTAETEAAKPFWRP
jgi:uncharacterized protein YjiS (DUF1127 family)